MPSGLDLDVLVGREQVRQASGLLGGEQAGAGVQCAARGVERVVFAAAVSVDGLLDAAPALVEGVAGQADHVEGIHDRGRVGQLFASRGLEAGEAVHRDDLHRVAPLLRALGVGDHVIPQGL